MNTAPIRSGRPPTALAVLFVLAAASSGTKAATLFNLGHAAGPQCLARSVNDTGTAVGDCEAQGASNARQAWVATPGGAETPLARLVTDHACSARGITNGGVVVGACLGANNVGFAVTWSSASPATAPLKLAPLSSLLGLADDVSTVATAFNQAGVIGGESLAANGASSAVLWLPGSSSPTLLSARGDHCRVVDMTDAAPGSLPTVLLDCPDAQGHVEARIARPGLPTTALATVPGSTHCTGAGIDNASRVIGTCAFETGVHTRATLWTSPGAPSLLPPSGTGGSGQNEASVGVGINNGGHMVFAFQRPDGHHGAAFLASVTSTPVPIPPLKAGTDVRVVAVADNDAVVVVSENASGYIRPAIFNPATGLSTAVPPLFPATSSVLTAVSMSGAYAIGTAEDNQQNRQAVIATLP